MTPVRGMGLRERVHDGTVGGEVVGGVGSWTVERRVAEAELEGRRLAGLLGVPGAADEQIPRPFHARSSRTRPTCLHGAVAHDEGALAVRRTTARAFARARARGRRL